MPPWLILRDLRTAPVLIAVFALLFAGCRPCSLGWLAPHTRELTALKNRTTVPSAADFDAAVTLEALLQPGDDRQRWSPARAATIEGYVVRVVDAGPELANCFSRTRVDTHIEIARTVDAPPRERVIVEVTPAFRERTEREGRDWSTATLQRTIVGRRVRVSGWLLFDEGHDDEAENTRPGGRENWRATAWEIHPVTAMTLVDSAVSQAAADRR